MVPAPDNVVPGAEAFAKAKAEGDLVAMTEAARTLPLHGLMGLTLLRLDSDSLTLTMEMSDAVQGAGSGTVHGGILATFADAASARW
jgi:acyl-coenzyme A thioesterase PaaI-like protein